ncbi:MAG: hypothetical protein JNL01_14650 [Bdellovibrionales bacterium]|nr:hypothetical protein [Bdellovibrionales bacterium]
MKHNRRISAFLAGTLGVAMALQAKAATYNFYFNNTEQGDGSTANPNVHVVPLPEGGAQVLTGPDAVAAKAGASPTPSPSPSVAEAQAVPVPAAQGESVQAAPVPSASPLSNAGRVRLIVSAVGESSQYEPRPTFTTTASSWGSYSSRSSETNGIGANLGVYLSDYFALNGFANTNSRRGIEMEIFPWGAATAGKGVSFEFSLLLGMNWGRASRTDSIWETGYSSSISGSDSVSTGHAGARATVYFWDRVGLTTSYRSFGGGAAEAGLVFRL